MLGGDTRQKYLTEMLREEGLEATHLFGEKEISNADLSLIFPSVDTVVFPVPTSRDSVTLNAPLCGRSVVLSDILPLCRGKTVLFGGMTDSVKALAEQNGIDPVDYFAREELTVMNAVATAEGALELAMHSTDHTIHGSRCLVIGYGRIGKVLAKMLDSLGAVVSASARKERDLAWIRAVGLDAVRTENVADVLEDCDIVFNTVPQRVMGIKQLACCKKGAVLIELASAPGGFDTTTAMRLGLNVIDARGLPGKVAPLSAAAYIKDTLLNIFGEENI